MFGKGDGSPCLQSAFRLGVAQFHPIRGFKWTNYELALARMQVNIMKTGKFRGRTNRESGQVVLFTMLALGLFLLGAMAFAIDLGNMWFNRQAAETAADAACTAGAMDMLVGATNGSMPSGANFTVGTSFDCNNASPAPAPCSYAALNGFGSSVAKGSTALGNNVSVSFQNTAPGVTPATATQFMKVTVINNIPTFFAGMLRGGNTAQRIGAT